MAKPTRHLLTSLRFLAGPRPIFEEEERMSEVFLSEKILANDRCRRLIRIFPNQSPNCRWSFRSLFVFLNELPGDWTDWRSAGAARSGGPSRLRFFYADRVGDGVNRIRVDVDSEWVPSVEMSRPDADWDAWSMQSVEEETREGTRGRENKKPHVKRMIWWQMNVTNIRGGNAWFKDASFLPVDASDFHPVVHKLARKLIRGGLEESRQRTRFIFALRHAFTKHRQPSLAIS
jgi:hypothetical protein